MPTISDWITYRSYALEQARSGFIPVYGYLGPELEEIVTECIFICSKQGSPSATLLINSNGGESDSLAGILSAMFQSKLEFTGLVTGRARSNSFNLLQKCAIRKATSDSKLRFHLGQLLLENAELVAFLKCEHWVFESICKTYREKLNELSSRSGLSVEELLNLALYERHLSASEALQMGFLDEVVSVSPTQSNRLDQFLKEEGEN